MTSKAELVQKPNYLKKVGVCLQVSDNVKASYNIEHVTEDTKIRKFKTDSELATGIPVCLQRLHYLDNGELRDESTVNECEIVSEAKLRLTVWSTWIQLVSAIITNNLDQVFKLIFDNETLRTTCSTRGKDGRAPERAAIALFIATSYGYVDLCAMLIDSGADVNWTSPETGRSVLHMAAARGQMNVVHKLLQRGALVASRDADGLTPIAVATKFGHTLCERHMKRFSWHQRVSSTRRSASPPLLPHQRYDSALPASLVDGPVAQVYRPQLVPPGEFGGTSFGAPRRRVIPKT